MAGCRRIVIRWGGRCGELERGSHRRVEGAEPAIPEDEGLHEERGDAGVFAGFATGGVVIEILCRFMLRIPTLWKIAMGLATIAGTIMAALSLL